MSPTPTGNPLHALRRMVRRGRATPLLLLAVGILAILLVLLTEEVRNRLVLENLERSEILGEIRTRVTTTHLWIEEFLTGDEIDITALLARLDRSRELARLLSAGGTAPSGHPLRPLTDPDLARGAATLERLLQEFALLSHQRHEAFARGEEVGIGSGVDRQYDLLFNQLADQADLLSQALRQRSQDDQRLYRMFFEGLLTLWALLILLAAVSLAKREKRRRAAEEALIRSEERFVQAQKMEAVGRLAGGVAHDINNYLAAITGHCELVRMKAEPGSRTAEKMDAVIATCFRASDLIKRLLAFSRRQPTQPQIIDPNRVIAGVEKMVRQLIGEDITLVTHLAPDLGAVRIDPSQLEQVIVNLVVNARDAMPRGGKVTVETANSTLGSGSEGPAGPLQRPAPGEYVLLAVTDEGAGIPEAIRDKIFEPFFTTKAEAGSSGLGLATVYAVVEQAGGHLWVYSEEGQGTTFKIYLPKSVEPEGHATPAAARPAPGGTETLLLVEDNADFRQSSHELLEGLGYRVKTARDGEEALELAELPGEVIDLVITDVVLPGMSGRDLAERLHARRPALPVLFVSGYTDNVVLRHGIQTGEVAFLQKPFSSEQLAQKIREVLA